MSDEFDTPILTPDFCRAAKEKLVFRPESIEEAQFIAHSLQNMGYQYYSADYATKLADALTGSIYLDTDKTIMVGTSRPSGIACSADGFGQIYMPEGVRISEPRLSPEDCKRRALVFYPRTAAEARGILRVLKENGISFGEKPPSATVMARLAVVQGILLRDGALRFGPAPSDLAGAEICTASDLGVNAAVALSPEQATIMAAFNEMSARMQQMSARIAALEKEVLPESMDKPRLPKPKGAP
jgi:hypothetical protein